VQARGLARRFAAKQTGWVVGRTLLASCCSPGSCNMQAQGSVLAP
jgi:hypothetical protein